MNYSPSESEPSIDHNGYTVKNDEVTDDIESRHITVKVSEVVNTKRMESIEMVNMDKTDDYSGDTVVRTELGNSETRPENCSGKMVSDCLLSNDSANLPVSLFQTNVKPKIDDKMVISDCFEHQKMPGYGPKNWVVE